MQRTTLCRAAVGATAMLCALGASAAPAMARATPNAVQAGRLGIDAFLYGYPLAEVARVRDEMTSVSCPDLFGNAPINTFSHTGGFARPQDRTVVAPNVDTLYSIAHLDLADGPVLLGHPDMGDRYFVFQFLDAYTNTVGYVGSRTTGSAARTTAIRWTGGPQEVAEGVPVVDVRTRYVWVIGRTLATDAVEDQRAANALMQQFSLTPPGGAVDTSACVAGPPVVPAAPHGISLLDRISAEMEKTPPPAQDDPLLDRIAAIGVGPGRSVSTAGLSLPARVSLDRTVKWVERALPSIVTAQQYAQMARARGWTAPPLNIGDYGTDYTTRAGVASIGLGANTEVEAAYRTAFLDSNARPLNGRSTYRLRFAAGQEPPNDAFWSVTVYDDQGFLYETSDGRHSVGSSHPPLKRRPDGSVEIQFSSRPPAADDLNWLATPSGRFRVYLRVYAPGEAVLRRAWRPPGIDRVG